MALDAKQLSGKEWICFIGGAAALISLFLPWYSASVDGVTYASVNAWSTGYGWIAAALLVAAAVYLLVRRQRGGMDLPVRAAVMALSLSAAGLLLALVRLGSLPQGTSTVDGLATFQYGGRAGILIAMIAGFVEVVCAGLLLRTALRGRKQPKTAITHTTL
jgi:hypothetical protein